MASLRMGAAESFVGSYSEVYRGRAYCKPTRTIEVTLGERRYWRDGAWQAGEQYTFVFDDLDDATQIAKAVLAEVKLIKDSRK